MDGFYRHPEMADGHLNICKECRKGQARKYRGEHIQEYRTYDLIRGNRQSARWLREHRVKNPEKYKAHTLVRKAVRNGTLVKPKQCQICGADGTVQGHHHDYSKPLDVEWLCQLCHSSRHKIGDHLD